MVPQLLLAPLETGVEYCLTYTVLERQNTGMNGSHVLLFGGHRKAQGKSEKSGEKDDSSELGTGLRKALHRGSALNWAGSRVQPVTDKQLPE